ncbi:MAG TPA: S41 family peptidase [Chloroflexaceae bacterium]|nr:S41 family peptidase [Chloroflexaceae bacterium]
MSDPIPQPYFRTPAVDPDGRRVAFLYAGDLWLADADGGPAERLTAHPASHFSPRFSPDGASLAFSASRSGRGDVYVLPLAGGPVRQLTFHDEYCAVEDWTPDGQALYVTADRDQIGAAIYRVGLDGGTPALVYSEPYEQLGQVAVSPDGQQLAFSNIRERWWRRGPNPYAPGEIWVGPSAESPLWAEAGYANLRMVAGPGRAGDAPRRSPEGFLTALVAPYAGRNAWPLWAPDGRSLFFVSDRDGAENLWQLPLDGEGPRQLTFFRDGRLLFPQIARRAGLIVFERDWRIWRLDPAGGEAAPIPISARGDGKLTPVREESWGRGFSELRLSPDGKKLAFVARGQVFVDFADKETDRDLRQGPSFRVTASGARESQIAWTPDSRGLVYVSDRHGEDELYRYDFAARQETRLTSDLAPKLLPRVSPDGRWVAYISGLDSLRLIALDGGEPRELCRARFVVAADLAWSPDSRWLAFLAQDERYFSNVYVAPVEGGERRQITFLSNLEGGDLLWAPNGQFLVFTTEQYRAEAQVVRVDLRPPAPLFREAEFEKLFEQQDQRPKTNDQSRDRRDDEPPEEVELARPVEPMPVETGELVREVPAEHEGQPAEDEQPTTDKADDTEVGTAKQDEDSSLIPHPSSLIEFEGIERRLRFLTPVQMDASAAAISPDSRDLLMLAAVAGKVNVWALPLDEPRADQPPRQLTASDSGKHAVQFTPDGRAFFYLDDGTITVRKFPGGGDALRVAVRGDLSVDFHREKRQIFGEAWRALRDSFYDPTFRGQDWAALRDRFAPLVAGAQTAEELHTLINLMAGELQASHVGSGFGLWSGGDGYTGILLDPVELCSSGRLRVQRVVPDSPAASLERPPRPGEYLLALDGVALGPGTSLDRLLRRTVGRRVRLTLGEAPTGRPRREVALRPVDAAEYGRLRYRDWVYGNERYVAKVSGGRLGYVHIETMSYPAYQQFLADLDAEAYGKDGVIVDVRYNGGGHTATFILDVLTRRSALLSGFRERAATDAGHLAGNRVLNKPTVLVTNERSASNTEMLSESYRRLGLGKVVGRPTAGAVIWTYSMRLLDGALLRLPRFSIVTPEGEDLEGRGRPVDVEVERPLGEWAVGRDRQLDVAVAALLDAQG